MSRTYYIYDLRGDAPWDYIESLDELYALLPDGIELAIIDDEGNHIYLSKHRRHIELDAWGTTDESPFIEAFNLRNPELEVMRSA